MTYTPYIKKCEAEKEFELIRSQGIWLAVLAFLCGIALGAIFSSFIFAHYAHADVFTDTATTTTASQLWIAAASTTANIVNNSWDLMWLSLACGLVLWMVIAIFKAFTGAARRM